MRTIELAAWTALTVACGTPQPAASVTITAPPASSSAASAPSAACPADYVRALQTKCTLGQICRYPQITCVCRMVPYCPGGAVRAGPPPPPESLEQDCIAPDCLDAAEGAPCPHAGVQCRGPACYSSLTCTGGRWKLVQLGPPP